MRLSAFVSALLGQVGRSQIDRNVLEGQAQAQGMQRIAHALSALGHGLVGQPDNGKYVPTDSSVLSRMSHSNWRSNIAVIGGVAAGILIALWFSTVVAMGPPPGSVSTQKESGNRQAQPDAPQHRAAPHQKKKTTEAETYCPDGKKRNDCLIQLRIVLATEAQANYALYGFVALIVTLLISVIATIAATSSARSARRVLTDLERPHVFVEVLSAGLQVDTTKNSFSLVGGRFEFHCVNYGRTPAALIELFDDVRILDAGQFPAVVDPRHTSGRQLPTGCVASLGKPYAEGDAAMKTYDWKLLCPDAIKQYAIFFTGYVRYADMILGTRYISGFCFVYDLIGDKFVRRGNNADYNYAYKEGLTPQPWSARLSTMWQAAHGRAPLRSAPLT